MHLQKLCVGVENIEGLQAWIDFRADQARSAGRAPEQFHTTRATPKQRDAILQGGSLYWVIKGVMQARQHIVDLRPRVGEDGITRCDIGFGAADYQNTAASKAGVSGMALFETGRCTG